ncbi:MAG: transglycosylase domain-containing protein [Gammaproteobacteria bacterium]
MGEHTIREILKRRSDDTQRVIRQRRERATKSAHRSGRSYWFWSIFLLVILAIISTLAYAGWLAREVNDRFLADRAANAAGINGVSLTLQSTTQFLPNTLLAATDPNFYNNSNLTISPVTGQLIRIYFPDDSSFAVTVMALALQFGYSRTDILETYINDIIFGRNAGQPIRGFATASQVYFKKPFALLQPQDMALLVALATDPESIDPRTNPGRALAMRNAVLQMDAQQEVLSQAQVDAFKKTPLGITP